MAVIKNYSGSISLTKLVYARQKSKKGAMCLVIPIDANLLEVDANGGVYLPLNIKINDTVDQFGNIGFVAKKIPSKIWKEATEEQKSKWKENQREVTPILGNFKDFSPESANATSGDAGGGSVFTEDDDLPF